MPLLPIWTFVAYSKVNLTLSFTPNTFKHQTTPHFSVMKFLSRHHKQQLTGKCMVLVGMVALSKQRPVISVFQKRPQGM
jgi:hypothetical protein